MQHSSPSGPPSVRPDTDDYLSLFLDDIPLMDVRAPVEFAQGAFPMAENLPLLDDRQREQVGLRYKEAGQDAAIALGLELATPEIVAQRLAGWRDFCERHPAGYLYCFRGGLRSRTTQQWLREQGVDYPLVKGGYKALRNFLLHSLEQEIRRVPLTLLAGATGSGKTRVLRRLPRHLDLEGLARHRGSAFGAGIQEQPSQIAWENAVAIDLLKYCHLTDQSSPLVLEDEGRLIGRIAMPGCMRQRMQDADLVVLEMDLESRVRLIMEDYIIDQWRDFRRVYGDQAMPRFREFVLGNLARIRKRLGGARHQELHGLFSSALERLDARGETGGFAAGIRRLLVEYYDPMYEYQLSRRQGRVLLRGGPDEILQWAVDGARP